MHLSFSFAFFVHGDSTVCASMDIREHPPVKHLTEEYLDDVVKNSQQNLDDCELNEGDEKEDFNVLNQNLCMQSVILAPFGLSAVLTGSRNENSEQYTEKIIEDWNAFYPLKKQENERLSHSKLPKLVEVVSGNKTNETLSNCRNNRTIFSNSMILGGVKMLYPSKYVLVTDLDINNKPNSTVEKKISSGSEKKICKCEAHLESSVFSSKSKTYCDGIQKSASGIMPERIWQDIVMNPAYTIDKSEHKNIENNRESSTNIANSNNTENSIQPGMLWNFVEPCLKNSCSCKR